MKRDKPCPVPFDACNLYEQGCIRMTSTREKDELIVALSRRGRATGEDLLLRFMDRYSLPNLAKASVEQLREFYGEHTK